MQAAEKLQQEKATNENEIKKYRLAVFGLLVTIIGLAAKIISEKFYLSLQRTAFGSR